MIKADVAELVDARDLKSLGAAEITHLSDLTRAGNPHEAGEDPAVLSNTPPPLPLAGRPSKTWADVFLPASINRRTDRCRLLQTAIAIWSLCAAVSTKPLRPPSGRRAAGPRPRLLILAAACAFERELTDLLPRLTNLLNLIVRTASRSRRISS